MSWLITIPKSVSWKDYQKEIDVVADGSSVMNYKVRYFPKGMNPGDRCYLVWDGRVRGWMEIVGLRESKEPWTCTTSGKTWPAGKYMQRSGPFHAGDGPVYKGFRGIRKFPDSSVVASKYLAPPCPSE